VGFGKPPFQKTFGCERYPRRQLIVFVSPLIDFLPNLINKEGFAGATEFLDKLAAFVILDKVLRGRGVGIASRDFGEFLLQSNDGTGLSGPGFHLSRH
jgi:hypothetical protein